MCNCSIDPMEGKAIEICCAFSIQSGKNCEEGCALGNLAACTQVQIQTQTCLS